MWVDAGWWNQPGMSVETHHDVPPVVMDLGVAALAQEATVVEVGGTAVSPVRDVVHLGM